MAGQGNKSVLGTGGDDILEMKRELIRIQARFRKGQDYSKAKEQLERLRKKLSDKRIWDTVNAEVYQLSARFALQYCDATEYEECEAQLVLLRRGGIRTKHDDEFSAYRLLYKLCYDEMKNRKNGEEDQGSGKDQRTSTINDRARISNAYKSFLDTYASLSAEEKRSYAVKHARACAQALSSGCYHTFFLLWRKTPDMGGYMLDHVVNRERLLAMEVICSAYKSTVLLSWLTNELSFKNEGKARDTFREHGFVILQAEDGEVLDMGSSSFSITGVDEAHRKRKSGDVLGMDGAQPDEIAENWSEHHEAQYGVPYYYNRITKKSTWQKPSVLRKKTLSMGEHSLFSLKKYYSSFTASSEAPTTHLGISAVPPQTI